MGVEHSKWRSVCTLPRVTVLSSV